MNKALIIASCIVLASFSAFGEEWGGAGEGPGWARKTISFGAELEAWTFDMDLVLDEFDGIDWNDDVIVGKDGVEDTDKNASYGNLRACSAIAGFMDWNPMKELSFRLIGRLGMIKEVYHAELDPGSFFLAADADPENETASFRFGTLMGCGARAALKLDDVRISAGADFSYDYLSYRNQMWFDRRTDGRLTAIAADIRLTAGYSFGFATPKAGVGALIYAGRGLFRQVYDKNGHNARMRGDFSAEIPVVVMIGADFEAGEKATASVEILLFGEYGLRVSAGFRF